MLGNEQNNNQTDEQLQSSRVKFDITNDFVFWYPSEKSANTIKTNINQYLRAIFPEVTNDTQRAITEDSLVGKDNIETLCEFVFKDIKLEKKYHQIKESSISSFYNYLNSKNKNIRNPIEYISLQKLYDRIKEIVDNNNLDNNKSLKNKNSNRLFLTFFSTPHLKVCLFFLLLQLVLNIKKTKIYDTY